MDDGDVHSRSSDRRFALVLYLAAVAFYALAISWGTPLARMSGQDMPWGSDELGPVGALGELHRLFSQNAAGSFNPQYPIFGQLLQAGPVGLYLAWLRITGRFEAPSPQYPFGLEDPVGSLATMTELARFPSLLLGAGVAVLALLTARELWGSLAGRFVGVSTLLLYPLGYYARTSNVDAPALFLTAAGMYVLVTCLSRGLDRRRLLAFGALAALATATKDASFAAFAAGGVGLLGHALWTRRHERGAVLATVALFLPALALSVGLYTVASGLVFSVERFHAHVNWVVNSTAARIYPRTLVGTLDFLREIFVHVLDTLGTPLLVASLVGVALAARRRPRDLLLTLPALGTIALTIMPAHFVNIRYVLVSAYLLALFSGCAVSVVSEWGPPWRRRVGYLVLACVLAWSFVRAVDLTNQMRNDSRGDLAAWLVQNTRDGDLVAYFGSSQKLPRVPRSLRFVREDGLCEPSQWRAKNAPDFVLVIPQQHFEIEHEWTMADDVFAGLGDGRLGYELVYRSDGPGWFARRPIPFVNPPVLAFARADRVRALSRQVEPRPSRRLAFLEERIGLTPGIPRGLPRNPARPAPCDS